MKIKKIIISLLAIICGIGFHGRFLVRLILDSIEYRNVSWGPMLMPAYAFTTSLTFCGVPFYLIGGLIFAGLNFVAIFVFENVGINRITAAINIFLILITPFTALL